MRDIRDIGLYIGDNSPDRVARMMTIAGQLRDEQVTIFCTDVVARQIPSFVRSMKGISIVEIPEHGGNGTPDSEQSTELIGPEEHILSRQLEYDPSTTPQHLQLLEEWHRSESPILLVLDGPPGIALWAYHHSLPIVVLRNCHRKTSQSYHAAYTIAREVIAPFSPILDFPSTPEWLREKSFFSGPIIRVDRLFAPLSSADQKLLSEIRERKEKGEVFVAVVTPGSAAINMNEIAAANPDWNWLVLGANDVRVDLTGEEERYSSRGEGDIDHPSDNLWQLCPKTRVPFFREADVMLAPPLDLLLVEGAIAECRLLCSTIFSPYEDLQLKGERLQEIGLATLTESLEGPDEWGYWLQLARTSPGRLHLLVDERGAQKAVRRIQELARRIRENANAGT